MPNIDIYLIPTIIIFVTNFLIFYLFFNIYIWNKLFLIDLSTTYGLYIIKNELNKIKTSKFLLDSKSIILLYDLNIKLQLYYKCIFHNNIIINKLFI